MDDILDAAQKQINDAATQAGGPPPPPPPPPPPSPEPPPPPPPAPPPPVAGQAKKRPIGILIATFLFLAGAVVLGANIIGQQRQIAEIRTLAACPKDNDYYEEAKNCGGTMVCTSNGWTCSTSSSPGSVGTYCDNKKCPWGCSAVTTGGGVCKTTEKSKLCSDSSDSTCVGRKTGAACTAVGGQGAGTCKGSNTGACVCEPIKKSTLCPYNCVQKSKCTGKNLGLGYGDCGAALFEYCCETGGGPGAPPKETGDNGDGGGGGKAACRDIKIYKGDSEVDPSTLKVGDAVVLALKGLGKPTKGRFRVNGGSWTETTTKNGKSEFTLDFTIPEGVTKFTIEGELFVLGKWR